MEQVQQQAGQGQGPRALQQPLRRRISSFIARTVDRFRITLLVILAAAAAFLVGYFIYSEVNKRIAFESAAFAEAAQDQHDKWQSESDATKKAALEKDLLDQLGKLIARYPRQYSAQRGLFLRADVNFADKAWDAALQDYESLATRFPKSYLAPISLFNAAVCREEKGDLDGAAKLYVQAAESYKDSTVAPRAIFNAGRVAEAKSSWTEAQQRYESLDSLHAQSAWNTLAKNRLIELKVQGKVK
jgi:TolA-binding protein